MPGFNQQGPRNQGPMTGRCMGICANGPREYSPNFGRGQALGFRRGRGQMPGRGMGSFWGRGYAQNTMTAQEAGTMKAASMEDLTLRAEMLESELKIIKDTLAALSKSADTPS